MDEIRLETIARTRRGKTYLIRRLVEVDKISHAEATRRIDKIWNDRQLTPEDLYSKLSEMLAVDHVSISNDQFLDMIKNAITHCEEYCMDPLMAVHMLCENIEKIGGLAALAKRQNRFADKL